MAFAGVADCTAATFSVVETSERASPTSFYGAGGSMAYFSLFWSYLGAALSNFPFYYSQITSISPVSSFELQ